MPEPIPVDHACAPSTRVGEESGLGEIIGPRLNEGITSTHASLDPESILPTVPTAPKLDATVHAPAGCAVGRYRAVCFHARGGLGEVYVAEDLELQRQVALKRIRPEHADDKECRRRFLLEAEVTAHLQHPGVVPVHGVVREADGRPSYAMRFIE